jgi:hypothetical protein
VNTLLQEIMRAFAAMSFANTGDNLGDFQRRLATTHRVEPVAAVESIAGPGTLSQQRRPVERALEVEHLQNIFA